MAVELSSPKRWLVAILTAALILRFATAFWLGNTMYELPAGGTHDQISYEMMAYRLATGHGFTFPEPWYPWVPADTPTSYYSATMVSHLALIYMVVGRQVLVPRLIYALLGVAIVFLVYRLGRRLFGETAGLISAACAAGYAYLILYSATLLTETPFIFFLLLALDTAYEITSGRPIKYRELVLLGVGLAGTVLFRMAVLPFVILLLAWLYLRTYKTQQASFLPKLAIPVLIIVLAVLPWTVRNYLLFDRFMLLESQFGHVFWNGNHPDRDANWGEVDWVAPIPAELRGLNEVDLTNELLRRGREAVVDEPVRFLRHTIGRVKVFFLFWPTADSSLMSNLGRVLSFGVMLPFMLWGVYLTRQRWRECLPLYLFVVLHCGVYLAAWAMVRYRIPADTVMLVFAGPALARAGVWIQRQYQQRRRLTERESPE